MTNLYVATRIITFFGAYVRTFWEHVACRMAGVPAEDVRAFKSSEMCGHVDHAILDNLKQSVIMCLFPFTMNFILGSCMLMTGSYSLFYVGNTGSVQSYVLVCVGFSLLANCAPSFEDALCFKDYLYSRKGKVIKVLLSPAFGVVYSMAYIERYSITFVLAALYTVFFPWICNIFFPAFQYISEALR